MATTNSSFLSQTLQSITTTKMREQDKRRKTFEARKAEILEKAKAESGERARLLKLLVGFKQLSSSNKGIWYLDADRERALTNAGRYVEQSFYDPSVSNDIFQQFESDFRQKLDQESQRFTFADLYYRLLSEWTDENSKPMDESEIKEEELDGSFEHVERYNLQKLKDKFTNVVFTPLHTEEVDIDQYLSSLFEDDHAVGLLEKLRKEIGVFGKSFKSRTTPFNPSVLKLSIKALLTNDLLNDDAKMTLSEFSTNDVVLNEIADVLNLRFSDLDNWSWDVDEGMYYEPRRQGNGKYRIMMDQDILQALFLHYIAVGWCEYLKMTFRELAYTHTKFWKYPDEMATNEKQRRQFFIGVPPKPNGIVKYEMDEFTKTFLTNALPSSLSHSSDPYGEERESGPNDDDSKTGLGIRQLLLRHIASNIITRQGFGQDVAVVQSDLQWYATGLPHSTLWAVLRFWGVPEDWIKFFTKFAEAPLRMSPTPGEDVRTRKRGIPITDAFEKLFGEVVLFSMDVAVNRLSDVTLIRFHDDLWLSGDPEDCAHAWETILGFVKTLGLDINTKKTGSVYLAKEQDPVILEKLPKGPVCMGMLQLTDQGEWAIDQKQVSAHTRQLQKQLGHCTSIISWIQTWNACMGKFFQNTFGKPANCFGQPHVDAILQTLFTMQKELFSSHNGSVTTYLREQVAVRFGVNDVPDSFFFLPEEFGGLGLQNPFTHFFAIRNEVYKDPAKRIRDYKEMDQKLYKEFAEAFGNLTEAEKLVRYSAVFGHSSETDPILSEPFFSYEEYSSHREIYSPLLRNAFTDLLKKPQVQDISLINEIKPWFDELRHSHNMGWHELSSEQKWIMNLYAEELKNRFGALSIVDQNLLPSGIMNMLKQKKVTWQLILWE